MTSTNILLPFAVGWRPQGPQVVVPTHSHTMLIASCSNLLAMVCWCLLVNTSSKDFKAEHNITFCVTFGLKPSSSFMITVGMGWCSALLNVEHNDLSQFSRKDAFCSNGKVVSHT
jgi:hypothetical protein